MAKKKKNEGKPLSDKKVKVFEYGDLVVQCSCGQQQILHKGISDGIQLVITPREDSFIQLRCDKCEASIKLCMIEGVKPDEADPLELKESPKEETADESISEEDKQ